MKLTSRGNGAECSSNGLMPQIVSVWEETDETLSCFFIAEIFASNVSTLLQSPATRSCSMQMKRTSGDSQTDIMHSYLAYVIACLWF